MQLSSFSIFSYYISLFSHLPWTVTFFSDMVRWFLLPEHGHCEQWTLSHIHACRRSLGTIPAMRDFPPAFTLKRKMSGLQSAVSHYIVPRNEYIATFYFSLWMPVCTLSSSLSPLDRPQDDIGLIIFLLQSTLAYGNHSYLLVSLNKSCSSGHPQLN